MAAKLNDSTDPIEVKQLCCLIYGQPGSRKTSLAQTADNPITLAFDPGIYRAYGRKKAVLFDTWEDVLQFDTAPYRTIIVDTIGLCLDKLTQRIIADKPGNGNRLGGLSLPGYGILKSQFAAWVAAKREHGQDLVFVAHEKAERHGDETYYCPDIVGGSYNTLMNHCDLVGYLHFENGRRVIDFAPTDRWMAKAPPCNWGQLQLPDFAQQPDFLAKLIAEAKASMGRVSEQSAAIASEVDTVAAKLKGEPTLPELNDMLARIAELPKQAQRQALKLVGEYATANGWKADKKTKQYIVAPVEEAIA